MAVGFKLSNVLSFELTDHSTIIITTKHIVYEMYFDDKAKADEFLRLVNGLVGNLGKKPNGHSAVQGKRSSFYVENSKFER